MLRMRNITLCHHPTYRTERKELEQSKTFLHKGLNIDEPPCLDTVARELDPGPLLIRVQYAPKDASKLRDQDQFCTR
jgi:hypothetical protein